MHSPQYDTTLANMKSSLADVKLLHNRCLSANKRIDQSDIASRVALNMLTANVLLVIKMLYIIIDAMQGYSEQSTDESEEE